MATEQPLSAQSRHIALRALEHNDAFAIYCERHADIVSKQIEAKIFDLATTDEECRVLRQARKLLAENYAPGKMLQSMLVQAKTEAEREVREREKAQQK